MSRHEGGKSSASLQHFARSAGGSPGFVNERALESVKQIAHCIPRKQCRFGDRSKILASVKRSWCAALMVLFPACVSLELHVLRSQAHQSFLAGGRVETPAGLGIALMRYLSGALSL